MGRALRNAPPTKAVVKAQAHALGILWDVFHPYDWAAVAVALDAFAEGNERQAQAILHELRATNGSGQSVGLELDYGFPSSTVAASPWEDVADFKKPHWVLQEAYKGKSVPYAKRPTNHHPAKVMPGRGARGDEYTLRNFYGVDTILRFGSEEEALEFAKDVAIIDRNGRVTMKRGGVLSGRALARRERGALLEDLASYRRIGAPMDQIRALEDEIAAYDEELGDEGATPNPAATPNRTKSGRVKVYDAAGVAKAIRETFTNRPVERVERLAIGWPPVMQAIGDSLSVAYGSDKWKDKDRRGRREVELYKHLAESRNRILARPGVIHDHDRPRERWPVIGPKVRLTEIPMPADFAVLGLFEGLDLKLHTGGTDAHPRFGRGDDGIIHVRVGHGYVGGSMIRWSEIEEGRADELFLFVYTKDGGVMFVVIGEELGIDKDGIVG